MLQGFLPVVSHRKRVSPFSAATAHRKPLRPSGVTDIMRGCFSESVTWMMVSLVLRYLPNKCGGFYRL